MKLNLDIIQDNLPKTYETKRFGPSDRTLSFGRPLLYGPDCDWTPGHIYVSHTDTLPRTPPPAGTAFICVYGRIPQDWLAQGIQLLLVSNATDVITVFNIINGIYDKFDDWEGMLRDELENDIDFNIKRILQLGSEILGNPISVTDHTLQVIFQCELITRNDGMLRVEVDDTPVPIPVEYSEGIKEACHLERMITVPYLTTMRGLENKVYCNNLYPLGYFTGCVYLSELARTFRESDFALADYFFGYFQKAFTKYLRDFHQTESPGVRALHNLLNHAPLSAKERSMLELAPGEHWLCFNLKAKQNKKYMPKDYTYATLSALMPWTVYAVLHHGEIVGLLRIGNGEEHTDNESMKFFREILCRMDYTACFSNEFTDLDKINDYLMQASYVAEKHVQCDSENPVCYFHEHILDYMLYECTGNLSLESLFTKGMSALIDHDRHKKTDYIHTLNIYLKNEMSVTRTSEELYIHRSSLLKRLEKIHHLIDGDLNDPDTRLYYRLCLALLENRQKDEAGRDT
ncbi:MAG: helix-turn-helix domain-containing protein [Eubacteriales bacterium]|nr:helix-turn-helix domain-containing protein [Eubacteriales bacterium]